MSTITRTGLRPFPTYKLPRFTRLFLSALDSTRLDDSSDSEDPIHYVVQPSQSRRNLLAQGSRPRWCALHRDRWNHLRWMAPLRLPFQSIFYHPSLVILVSSSCHFTHRLSINSCPPSNPIQDATDSTIACNDDGSSPASQKTATVAAGSKITAYWNQVWPHPQGPVVSRVECA